MDRAGRFLRGNNRARRGVNTSTGISPRQLSSDRPEGEL